MAAIPECVNYVKKGGCWRSDVVLEQEGPEHWSFRCRTCRLLFVVSKDGVRDRSQFEVAAQRRKQVEEEYQRRLSRRKFFT